MHYINVQLLLLLLQASQVIARLPILPALKQELKAKKAEVTKTTAMEPVPGTSQGPPAAEAERLVKVIPEVITELTTEEKEDEPDEENVDEYIKKYIYVIWQRQRSRGEISGGM